jgi:hypothetical protein
MIDPFLSKELFVKRQLENLIWTFEKTKQSKSSFYKSKFNAPKKIDISRMPYAFAISEISKELAQPKPMLSLNNQKVFDALMKDVL